VINTNLPRTNLPPILHRFRDLAFDMSKIAYVRLPLLLLTPNGGVPCDDLRKILPRCQRMGKVPYNGEEILQKILIAWAERTNVTDRRIYNGIANKK